MRRQACADALANPEQPLAQFGESGAAALLLDYKGLAHPLGPGRDQAPRLPIGHSDAVGGFGELAGVLDRVQQGEKLRIDLLLWLATGLPDQIEVEHGTWVGHMRIITY